MVLVSLERVNLYMTHAVEITIGACQCHDACRPEERQRLEALRDAQAGITAAAAAVAAAPVKGKPAKPDPKVQLLDVVAASTS